MSRVKLFSYLIKNRYSYCLRIVVPSDLRQTIGLREIRYSLRTGLLGEAKYRSLRISGRIHQLFRNLRKMKDAPFDASKITQIFREELKSIEEAEETEKLYGMNDSQYHTALTLRKQSLEKCRNALGRGDFTTVKEHINRIMKHQEMWTYDDNPSYRKLCLDLLKLEAEFLERSIKHLEGQYLDDKEISWVQQTPPEEKHNSQLLSVVINKYLEEESRIVTLKTKEEYVKCLRLLVNSTVVSSLNLLSSRTCRPGACVHRII
jgi:hypothetical protein